MIARTFIVPVITIIILSLLITFQLFQSENHFPKLFLREKPFLEPPIVTHFTGNVPDFYLSNQKTPKTSGQTCGKFPDFFDLRFKNDLWQMQNTTNGTLHLFNAYMDPRNGGSIRIVVTYDVYRVKSKFFCQYWFGGATPKSVESEVPYWMFRPKWGADKGYFHHPYLVTCPLVVHKGQPPVSVSLVEKSCDSATNNLKIFNYTGEKKNFVVCVKGLSFPFSDLSTRLVEWIELLRLLGADKINFYEFSVHGNVQKVLDYYQAQGFVETTPITLVGDYSNEPFFQNVFLRKKITPRRLQEVIPYNDCLYKHLQGYKYVVLLDTDEVIVPIEGTWAPLVKAFQKQYPKVNSFMARNVYFLDSHMHQHEWFSDIPKYMHMLQHVYRAKNYTKPGNYVKGFHDTTKVVALHNHFPLTCINGGCNNKEMDIKMVHLQHYRSDCVAGVKDCKVMKNNSVTDYRVWNFKEELIEGVNKTLMALGLLSRDERR